MMKTKFKYLPDDISNTSHSINVFVGCEIAYQLKRLCDICATEADKK